MERYSKDYEAVRKMFWDGTDEQGNQYCLDRAGITYALGRALRDYTSRTDKKQSNEMTASVQNMLGALCEFADELWEYFSKPPKKDAYDFDQWHHDMCELFIRSIQNAGIRKSVTYGKAQKILNMTMKTIYCLEGAKKYAQDGYFCYCHMPLDSIIINWFRTYLAKEWYNESKARDKQIKISQEGGLIPSWSSLTFKDGSTELDFATYDSDPKIRENGERYHYMFFVTMIREYFREENTLNRYDGLTPFKAEFYIWVELQYEQAAQGLIKQDLVRKLVDNPSVSVNNKVIGKLNSELGQLLDTLSCYY